MAARTRSQFIKDAVVDYASAYPSGLVPGDEQSMNVRSDRSV
jgi:hypothetical protein